MRSSPSPQHLSAGQIVADVPSERFRRQSGARAAGVARGHAEDEQAAGREAADLAMKAPLWREEIMNNPG